MAGHGHGRKEIRCPPLHINTLQGIGVVAHPKLVEVGQHTVIGPSPALCASLQGQVGVFLPDTAAYSLKSAMVGYIQMALPVTFKIMRTVIQYTHIGIPLDIIYTGILRHQAVHHAEHVILHIGIGQIQHQLCPAAAGHRFSPGSLYNPIGVLLIQFAPGIRHFRFYPNTEFDAALLCLTE